MNLVLNYIIEKKYEEGSQKPKTLEDKESQGTRTQDRKTVVIWRSPKVKYAS